MTETTEQADRGEIPFSARATFEDFRRAQAMRAAASETMGKGTRILRTMGPKIMHVFMFVLIAILLLSWLPGLNLFKGEPVRSLVVVVLGIYAAGAVLLGLLRQQGLRTAWKRLEHRSLRGFRGAVFRDAIVLENDYAMTRMEWPSFTGYDEDRGVLILSCYDHTYEMLTRAMFHSEQDWQGALSIIAKNLPRSTATKTNEEEMPAANCSMCSRGFPKSSMVVSAGEWSCAKCKDIAALKLKGRGE